MKNWLESFRADLGKSKETVCRLLTINKLNLLQKAIRYTLKQMML